MKVQNKGDVEQLKQCPVMKYCTLQLCSLVWVQSGDMHIYCAASISHEPVFVIRQLSLSAIVVALGIFNFYNSGFDSGEIYISSQLFRDLKCYYWLDLILSQQMIVGRNLVGVVSKCINPKYIKLLNPPTKCNPSYHNHTHYSTKYQFSTLQTSYFIFNVQKQPQLLKLQLQYRSQQNVSIFEHQIRASTGVLDQMNISKIFTVMETSPYRHQAYEGFFDFVRGSVKRKSDNMLLLLATVKERMARYYKSQKNIEQTIVALEEALEILEECMVPPLLPYYSVYRQYGLLMHELNHNAKAKQILIQAVEILDDFVSHSDDNVSTNSYCKKQATAYNVLAVIDEGNEKKWIEKAMSIWDKFTENRLKEVEYAKSVANNLRKEMREDREKGEAYFYQNLYKFETQEMKDILKRAKEDVSK